MGPARVWSLEGPFVGPRQLCFRSSVKEIDKAPAQRKRQSVRSHRFLWFFFNRRKSDASFVETEGSAYTGHARLSADLVARAVRFLPGDAIHSPRNTLAKEGGTSAQRHGCCVVRLSCLATLVWQDCRMASFWLETTKSARGLNAANPVWQPGQ